MDFNPQENQINKDLGAFDPKQLPQPWQQFCASGQSITDLAHLVKNIIQMVSGSAEIIELGLERKQYDRIVKSWKIFRPNLTRLNKFILDLIKYTKQYPLQLAPCDFNQIVQKAIKSCDYILKNKAVKIQLKQDKKIPEVQLDAGKIEDLVSNLITHALDNLPDHIGSIHLQTSFLKDHQQIQLTVRDNGPLLPKEILEKLAEPFERTRNMCGTGFDIALAKQFIEQHHGYMEIGSAEGFGNTVTIYLPINLSKPETSE